MRRFAAGPCLVAALVAAGAHASTHAQSLDEAHLEFARAVYRHSAGEIHAGAPQALLRAVVVLHVRLDPTGHWRADVLRENDEQPALTRRALSSVHGLAPASGLAPDLRARLQSTGFTESWLFQNDGRFALRSLAPPQLHE